MTNTELIQNWWKEVPVVRALRTRLQVYIYITILATNHTQITKSLHEKGTHKAQLA